jgi:CRP/FNR family transcriptional regulator, cyclic AMP receptor protein
MKSIVYRPPDFDLLKLVPEPLRQDVMARMVQQRFSAGRTVVEKGGPAGDVYFVCEGTAQINLYSPLGREVSVHQAVPGDTIGELAALDGDARSANVMALTDLTLLRMSRADFLHCMQSAPEPAIWLARRMSETVRRLTERVFELSALNVQMRIQAELVRIARTGRMENGTIIVSPAPTHLEMANRVGTHREAITREFGVLVEQKILRTSRRTLEFLDLPRLERAVLCMTM